MILEAGITLFAAFVVLSAVGMPIGISIAAPPVTTSLLVIPLEAAASTSAQKMVPSLNSFSLVMIPLFAFSGVTMNSEGTVQKLVNSSMLLVGRVSGALVHTSVLGNALFDSTSNFVITASTAIGGVLIPQQVNEGYDRKFVMAVNITSTPIEVVILPGTVSTMHLSVAGGTSISLLSLGGYLVGSLWVLGIVVVAYVIAKRHNYPAVVRAEKGEVSKAPQETIPSVLLTIIITDGILTGLFTTTEVSATAVAYSLLTSMFYHKTVKINDLLKVLEEAVLTNGTIMLLLTTSSMTSFTMALTGIPEVISTAILGVTDNKYLILLLVNAVLSFMEMFMDAGPATPISTPIFLPIVMNVRVDPARSGLSVIMNLYAGSITPPVGAGLYVGADVGGVKAEQMLKPPVPFHLVVLAILFLIMYVPRLVMRLSNLTS